MQLLVRIVTEALQLDGFPTPSIGAQAKETYVRCLGKEILSGAKELTQTQCVNLTKTIFRLLGYSLLLKRALGGEGCFKNV